MIILSVFSVLWGQPKWVSRAVYQVLLTSVNGQMLGLSCVAICMRVFSRCSVLWLSHLLYKYTFVLTMWLPQFCISCWVSANSLSYRQERLIHNGVSAVSVQQWACFAVCALYRALEEVNKLKAFYIYCFLCYSCTKYVSFLVAVSLKQGEGERGASEVMFTDLLKQTEEKGNWAEQVQGKHAVGVLGRRANVNPPGT